MKAQQILVDRLIDWGLVRDRLTEYSAIGSHFPESALRSCSTAPPYYCHPIAWRLGTWHQNGIEAVLERLDRLLANASTLPNWEKEFVSFPRSPRFEEFWSLLWQLQVSDLFASRGATVSWSPAGPDLRVEIRSSRFYVECYSYQKSFGMENFVDEALHHVAVETRAACGITAEIRVHHHACLPFSLPKDRDADPFLDELIRPFLDVSFVEDRFRESQRNWPVLLPVPDGAKNFYVYVEGPDHSRDVYDATIIPNRSGDPETYLRHAMREAIDNKRSSNRLTEHRPNLLAINFLLGHDYYLADTCCEDLGVKSPLVDLSDDLDAVLTATCGIDADLADSRIRVQAQDDHPLKAWIKEQGLVM